MFQKIIASIIIFCSLFLFSCHDDSNEVSLAPQLVENKVVSATAPDFNADNAYELIKQQVAFGPRVPGSVAHKKCAEWIQKEIKKYVDTVYEQKTTVIQPISNVKYPCNNIIGSINPTLSKRILLLCHWDSRPWADEDVVNQDKPIDAADDAGSGVAILLEIAAKLKTTKPDIGVDFLFVDVEDVGKSELENPSNDITTFCLGTTYWALHPHVPNYTADFGICLDMVGAKGAQFPLEGYSAHNAGDYQKRIWDIANRIGYSSYFSYLAGGMITDDHVEVMRNIHIPTVDIINLQPSGGFGKHWHTHQDNMSIIDKATLKAVGQTVMQVLFEN